MKHGDTFDHEEMKLRVKEWQLAGHQVTLFTRFVGNSGVQTHQLDEARTVNVVIDDRCYRLGRLLSGVWYLTSWSPGDGGREEDDIPEEVLA